MKICLSYHLATVEDALQLCFTILLYHFSRMYCILEDYFANEMITKIIHNAAFAYNAYVELDCVG